MRKPLCVLLIGLALGVFGCSSDSEDNPLPEKCDPETYSAKCIDGSKIIFCDYDDEAKGYVVREYDGYCQSLKDISKEAGIDTEVSNGNEILENLSYNFHIANNTKSFQKQNNDVLWNEMCWSDKVNITEHVQCLVPHIILNKTCIKMPDGETYWRFSGELCDNICLYDAHNYQASCAKSGDQCKNIGPIGCNRDRAYYCHDVTTGDHGYSEIVEEKCNEGEMCISDPLNTSCRPPCGEPDKEIKYCLYTDSHITGTCAPSPWKDGKYYPQAKPLENYYGASQAQGGMCIDGSYIYLSTGKENGPGTNPYNLKCASEEDNNKGTCLSNTAIICDYASGYYEEEQCRTHRWSQEKGEYAFENGERCMMKGSFPYCSRPCFEIGERTSYWIMGDFNFAPSFVCQETPNGLYYILEDKNFGNP